jgi:hypothetical protein
MVQDNRRRYRNLSTLETFKPVNLERDNIIEFKLMRQERELNKLMKQRDNLPHEKNDRTSWSSLKKLNYALKEE